MAEINVRNKSSNQGSSSDQGQAGNRQELQRQQGGRGLSRYAEGDPFGFSLNPQEFFSNPFAVMRRMSEEMDRAFAQFYGQQGGRGAQSGWLPAVEVSEREGQLLVHAELPGLKPEDVKVEVTQDALVIRGERKYEHEQHTGRTHHSERRYGEFYREIALPEGANAEQARAQFRDGVLEVTIPVPQQASKRREIPISSGETATSAPASAAAAAGAGGGVSGGTSGATSSGQTGSSTQKR
jgi:HSP20 family protein